MKANVDFLEHFAQVAQLWQKKICNIALQSQR